VAALSSPLISRHDKGLFWLRHTFRLAAVALALLQAWAAAVSHSILMPVMLWQICAGLYQEPRLPYSSFS
jgi:hypothetical protein